jgi:hypothetical protein
LWTIKSFQHNRQLQDQVTKAWTVKHYGTIFFDPEAGDSLHAKNAVIVCLLETR